MLKNSRGKMKTLLAIIFTLLFIAWGVAMTFNSIMFNRGCGGYLKRAADANTTKLATENLEIAVKYAKDNGLTSGYTSIVYRTPDEDVGFWYDNLKESLKELQSTSPDASRLEKTNALMKLRETLLDSGQSTSVTAPAGISRYPHNGFLALWGWLSFILAIIFW